MAIYIEIGRRAFMGKGQVILVVPARGLISFAPTAMTPMNRNLNPSNPSLLPTVLRDKENVR